MTPQLRLRITGSGENRHAYWLLEHALDIDELERLNLRLARTLGADDGVVSKAHTILRVAGTHNHKHQPPTPVTLERATGELHTLATITAAVADVVVDEAPRPLPADQPSRRSGEDPLLGIAPAVYLQALTGLQPRRDGKVSCPFHQDAEPSLHVYSDPARGWYCYSCRRGGSIYDLAAQLWDRDPRGREFLQLRSDLEELLGVRT